MYRSLEFLAIAVGSVLLAVSTNLLVIPNHLAGGGVGGFLTVIQYLFGTPIGVPMLLINLPFVYWLYRLQGWSAVLKTVISVVFFSLAVDLIAPWQGLAPTHDRWLASVWAGILSGVGNWIILYAGGNSGGTALIGKILRITKGWEIQTFMLGTDALIMVGAGIAMKDLQMTMYSVVMSFFVRTTIDSLTRIIASRKKVTIHSSRADEIAQAIIGRVRRGATLINGVGAYTHQPRQIIECILSHGEVRFAIDLARAMDPQALIDVVDVSEAHGPGFDIATRNRPVPIWKKGTLP